MIREQGFTEAHAEITEKSLFFAILYLPTLTLETKSPFKFLSLKKSLLIDDKHGDILYLLIVPSWRPPKLAQFSTQPRLHAPILCRDIHR